MKPTRYKLNNWFDAAKGEEPLSMTGQDIGKLMSFYDVNTVYALVEMQHRHIERLQAQLPQLRDEFPDTPRKG